MADRLYRLIQEAPVLQRTQILWGPDGPGGRAVIEVGDNLAGPGGEWDRMRIRRGDPGGYDERLVSGEWLLTDHSSTSNVLSARDYIEIIERTARLQGGRIAHTNSNITRGP